MADWSVASRASDRVYDVDLTMFSKWTDHDGHLFQRWILCFIVLCVRPRSRPVRHIPRGLSPWKAQDMVLRHPGKLLVSHLFCSRCRCGHWDRQVRVRPPREQEHSRSWGDVLDHLPYSHHPNGSADGVSGECRTRHTPLMTIDRGDSTLHLPHKTGDTYLYGLPSQVPNPERNRSREHPGGLIEKLPSWRSLRSSCPWRPCTSYQEGAPWHGISAQILPSRKIREPPILKLS